MPYVNIAWSSAERGYDPLLKAGRLVVALIYTPVAHGLIIVDIYLS